MSAIFIAEIFAAFFIGLFLVSRLSGWSALSTKYPFRKQSSEEDPRFFSISIRGTGFQLPGAYPWLVVRLGMSQVGMNIVSWLPFHKSIFIPWSEVVGIKGGSNWIVTSEKIMFNSGSTVELKKWGIRESDPDISKYWKSLRT